MLHWHSEKKAGVDDLRGEGDDEGNSGKKLYKDQPPRHHPLSDQAILVSPNHGTSCEQPIKLEFGETEMVKAELPETHVCEGRLSVRPRHKPVGRGEGNQEENPSDKTSNTAVEKLD